VRKVRYSVAMSLDGYIAGPSGEYDWIVSDPAVNFAAFFKKIDTVLMGRGTFEVAVRDASPNIPGMRTIVFSRTLRSEDYPDVTISDEPLAMVESLRAQDGKDIWLMGGGKLFHDMLDAGLVDIVEVGIVPILLGEGLPMLPTISKSTRLKLIRHEVFPAGNVLLRYEVVREDDRPK
jgi:dihydrofolate reductase